MKNKYVIAIDLDGTLVNNFDHYDMKSLNYLKELKNDHYIIISTGRPFRSSKYCYDYLELNTPIINYNGSLVHNPSDISFEKTSVTMKKEYIKKFFNDNKNDIINIFCEVEDTIYLSSDLKDLSHYLHSEGANIIIGDINENLTSNPNGTICFAKVGSEERITSYFENHFNKEIKARFWGIDTYLIFELYNASISKAEGIKKICKYYNIPRNNLIAIGDGHNDIELLKEANYSVAMGQSHPELLKIAKYKTSSCSESGVYEFLYNFFNSK